MKKIILPKACLAICLLSTPAVEAQIFSDAQICKATIALEMGAPIETIATIEEGKYPIVSYRRVLDGQRFTYSCKLSKENGRVVWRAYNPDEKGWARWRDEERDPDNVYSASGEYLTIKNNQLGRKTFQRSQL